MGVLGAQGRAGEPVAAGPVRRARCSLAKRMAIEPSPAAEATRLTELLRTSPQAAVTRGAEPHPNACTAARAAPVAVLCCCTPRPSCSNLASDLGGAKGTRTPDPCVQTTGSTSTSAHSRRSPSLDVYPGPCGSGPVAVLSCCTHHPPSTPCPDTPRDSTSTPEPSAQLVPVWQADLHANRPYGSR